MSEGRARLLATVLAVVGETVPDRAASLTAETPLVETGLLDSVAIMNVVEELERRVGRDFPAELLLPETFATAAVLTDALLASGGFA
ncbi:MAG: hypothetical protein K1X89_09990 [Myxococcaceae bacterium]|nr:hypothetical protein [Myxococcaceae bacterium]